MIPPFILGLVKKPTVIAIAILAVALGAQSLRAAHLKSSMLRCEKTQAEMVSNYESARADAAQAARDALQRAIEERDTQIQHLREVASEAAQRAQEASEKAAEDARAWKERYEAAKRGDPGCKAWSEAPISCPVD